MSTCSTCQPLQLNRSPDYPMTHNAHPHSPPPPSSLPRLPPSPPLPFSPQRDPVQTKRDHNFVEETPNASVQLLVPDLVRSTLLSVPMEDFDVSVCVSRILGVHLFEK
ncbi:hypothetical protein V1477_010035 [Vespula maculifrons]|uniref:Uncharacterized protein n=3 Tax=Vespula TaxID=7451 RepID=A0A834K423_VESGE|nr:hypothetical protein HZH66_007559 [Vespula vulgaris]KAF7399727.1 hypothetical protein HZH68_008319 [Vespula germanica]